jgi:sugar/nucleoside kinase (ribokinase family)
MSRQRLLVAGDVVDDLLVTPDGPIAIDTDTPSTIVRRAGGSAANTACWLARAGAAVTLVGSVGAEDLDRHRLLLEEAGVTAALTGTALPTGTVVVLSDGITRTMLTSRGANTATGPETIRPHLAGHARLHLTGHLFTGKDRDAGWRELLDDAAGAGLARSVAPGSSGLLAAYGSDRFRDLVAGAELLLASRDEAELLTGRSDPLAAAESLATDHRSVVVTCGRDGAVGVEDGHDWAVAAVAAEPVDVTGAGDAFAAGLLAALGRGGSMPDALAAAVALAAAAVGLVGARPAGGGRSGMPGARPA